jgi:hypothetical protein
LHFGAQSVDEMSEQTQGVDGGHLHEYEYEQGV